MKAQATQATEFDLIGRYFKRPVPHGMLGGGDDCALFSVQSGKQIATSTDLLLEGRHFFSDVDPRTLGHKALAVNLSDLAAMGATPIACLLGLGLPGMDTDWIEKFADGFYALADAYACPLIGGDTTRSLHGVTLSVTVFGAIDPLRAMRRSAAQAGDEIWVSGYLGAADIACRMLADEIKPDPELLKNIRHALELPVPRVELGSMLAEYAHAAIDVSDGLLQDLGHILTASGCGAQIFESQLPIHSALSGLPETLLRQAALAGGDLYELCFTAPVSAHAAIQEIGRHLNIPLTPIGRTTPDPSLQVLDRAGWLVSDLPAGFDHFRT